MRYLADLLTLTRLIIAVTMLVLDITGAPAEAILIMFIVAELTDAFDGTCSRKWPFPKNKAPRYRKYAAKFDMVSDTILAGAEVLYVINQVNRPIGLAIAIYYVVSGICGDLLVYGKVLGHPDDCTKNSLARRNFPLAKKIILTRRYLYTLGLGVTSLIILFATSWPTPIKIAFFILGCGIYLFAWFFLRQRRHNISRDAVDIEQKLSKKSHKR